MKSVIVKLECLDVEMLNTHTVHKQERKIQTNIWPRIESERLEKGFFLSDLVSREKEGAIN